MSFQHVFPDSEGFFFNVHSFKLFLEHLITAAHEGVNFLVIDIFLQKIGLEQMTVISDPLVTMLLHDNMYFP